MAIADDQVDALLWAFSQELGASPEPDTTLTAWLRRYPALRDELVAIAVQLAAGDIAPGEIPDDDAIARTAAALAAAPSRPERPPDAKTTAGAGETLRDLIQRQGRTLADLAALLHVPLSLVELLGSNDLDSTSIPVRFAQQLAAAISVPYGEIVTLLWPGYKQAGTGAVAEAQGGYRTGRRFDDLLAGGEDADRAYWDAQLPWAVRLGDSPLG